MNIKELIKQAIDINTNSYAPYSGFNVSAVLVSKEKNIYTGVNIENASYSMTICAERNAIFSAVSNGEKEFEAIIIVGGKDGEIKDYCPPCGACRQVMAEFCDEDFMVILAKSTSDYKVFTLKELLPEMFCKANLNEENMDE